MGIQADHDTLLVNEEDFLSKTTSIALMAGNEIDIYFFYLFFKNPVSAIFGHGGHVLAGDAEDTDPGSVQHREGLVPHLEQQPLRSELVHRPVHRHRGHVSDPSGLHAPLVPNNQRHAHGKASSMTSRLCSFCDWT